MPNFLRFFTLLIALSLVGCGATLPKVKPYKMDIQQGNVVTSEMLLKLRPGMTKSQVKFIMGTPLLVDSFRTNRWDYFYQLRKQGKIVNQRRVILDFDNDLLKGVRGDVVAKGKTAEDVAKQLEMEAAEAAAAKPVATEEESVEPSDLVVTPMEAPAIESTEATLDTPTDSEGAPESENGDVPASVLAVPIGVEPVVDAATEPAPTEAVKEELTSDEMPSSESPKEAAAPVPTEVPEEPVLSEAKVEPETEILKEMPTPDAVDTNKGVLTVIPAKADINKLVFRLDHSLDTTRIIPVEVSSSKAPLQDSVVEELKENQDQPTAIQDEPNFFERMLEKIGF